jgi:Flp pilus assembly CpaE family ATPase
MFVERSGNKDGTLRGSLSVLLVGDEEVQKAQPREALLALSEPALDVVEAALEQANSLSTKADVVMVLFGGGEEAALGCLQGLAECSPRPVLFALLGEQSEALMRRVLRAGADEVLFLPLVQGDLMRTLFKVSEARRRSERRAGGMIFSVTSMGGGTGVTALCANLGLALLSGGGVRVALVDLDLQKGGLGNLLGAEPERGILALAA